MAVSEEGKNMLGVPVPEGMVGIAVSGGVTPFCAAQELGYDIDIKIAEEIEGFETLSPIADVKKYLNLLMIKFMQKLHFYFQNHGI